MPIILIDDAPRQKAVALLEAALAGYQHQLYARMASALSPGGSLAGAGKELAGGKKLLAAYVAPGLPTALESDEMLHSLLFGSQGLLDDAAITMTFALSVTQPISDVQLAVNQRLALEQAGVERAAVLGELLASYMQPVSVTAEQAAPGISLAHVTEFVVIVDARRDLRLARAFSIAGGAGGAGRRMFIPVVSK